MEEALREGRGGGSNARCEEKEETPEENDEESTRSRLLLNFFSAFSRDDRDAARRE
jgi:hypothetical protein